MFILFCCILQLLLDIYSLHVGLTNVMSIVLAELTNKMYGFLLTKGSGQGHQLDSTARIALIKCRHDKGQV